MTWMLSAALAYTRALFGRPFLTTITSCTTFNFISRLNTPYVKCIAYLGFGL
jgi:hypothetical protein